MKTITSEPKDVNPFKDWSLPELIMLAILIAFFLFMAIIRIKGWFGAVPLWGGI